MSACPSCHLPRVALTCSVWCSFVSPLIPALVLTTPNCFLSAPSLAFQARVPLILIISSCLMKPTFCLETNACSHVLHLTCLWHMTGFEMTKMTDKICFTPALRSNIIYFDWMRLFTVLYVFVIYELLVLCHHSWVIVVLCWKHMVCLTLW